LISIILIFGIFRHWILFE